MLRPSPNHGTLHCPMMMIGELISRACSKNDIDNVHGSKHQIDNEDETYITLGKICKINGMFRPASMRVKAVRNAALVSQSHPEVLYA